MNKRRRSEVKTHENTSSAPQQQHQQEEDKFDQPSTNKNSDE